MSRTFIDRGGTFTDVVHIEDDGTVHIRKVPSDQAVIGELTRGSLRFGTTVATNALLERTGVRTLALVDEGFEDFPWIGDMTRPELFDLDARRPPPLCDRAIPIRGRIDAQGRELEPLELPHPSVLDGFAAVAIARLHSTLDPRHELAIAEWVAAHAPHMFIALGHQLCPGRGLLARLETALVHAAITPVLTSALTRDRVPADALAIRSDASLVEARDLIAPDAVLSGPAGGVLAVLEVAQRCGFQRAVGLDMGGTSTDVCRVDGQVPRRTGRVEVAGIHLDRPIVAVDTIAAGGGSICWSDGTRLGVGPRSAGADPGPQCYGRGGPPTLTDAALALGWVEPGAFDPPLDPSCIDLPGRPEDFVDIAQEQMAAAVRKLALSEGADLTDHALVAFGGAAGQHAAGVAERLGISTVLIHPCAAVLSAWGQAHARREVVSRRSLHVLLGSDRVAEATEGLLAGSTLPDTEVTYILRYAGTEGDIALPTADGDSFRKAHQARFGFVRDAPIEVREVVVRARDTAIEPPTPPALEWTRRGDVLDLGTTSVVVPPGWSVSEDNGVLRLHRGTDTRAISDTTRTEAGVALWSARFMAVAEQGGAVLQRVARSVNVRERLDFSCAVFDRAGQLVANAPHIPVHLGAMGVTVRSLIAERSPEPGTHWLTNDPTAGGSHLPDLTVITVGQLGGEPVYVASRAHHVDVGGTTPGSMPPRSTRLSEEGMVFRHVELHADGSGPDLSESRRPETVRADLVAQLAANHTMLDGLSGLGEPDVVHRWMAHILDAADALLMPILRTLPASAVTTDTIDSIALSLALSRQGDHLRLDFTGCGGPHPGNLNAPSAVVRAAVLYGLRVLVDTDIPLNEGLLRRVEIVLPEGSIVAPPPEAAVAGGNVETSMRIADLLLAAADWAAPSAGTMNNLTFGGRDWAYYETLGGGQGGTRNGPGAHARQLHMTNTRATDPEVLEHRVPLRVRAFRRRPGSGEPGKYAGGDGLIREIEVLEPCTASLLATRRTGPRPGADHIHRGGRSEPWDGRTIDLAPGDRVEVCTPGGRAYPSEG